jgi:aminoglycoside 3-N-acetyltransferase
MRTYRRDELLEALRAVGAGEGRILLVHSSLMSLGLMEGCRPVELAASVYSVLREAVGDSGTIVAPTFTFEFCNGIAYDPATTPSKGMGALSEYVRTLPEAQRSPHPMQSVAAVGPAAKAICTGDTASSFSEDGPFAHMVRCGARGLLLGAPMQSFSLVHLAEECQAVPYRYWKDFTAPYGPSHATELRTYRMYVRNLALDPRLVLSRVEDILAARGQIAAARCGSGWIKGFETIDFLAVTTKNLSRDPCWLLQDRPMAGGRQ